MRRLITCLLFICTMAACATSQIVTKNTDNSTCTASYTSVLRKYDGINMSACGATGNVTGVGGDEAVSQSLLNALIRGLK